MKTILSLVTATVTVCACYSQNVLFGTITDNDDGEPLPGATIHIPDLRAAAASDGQGAYQIKNLPSGRFLVEVRYVGFETNVMQVNIVGSTELNVALYHSAVEVSKVVVTGVSRSTELSQSPYSAQVVTSEQLAGNTGNAVDVVADQPGVSQMTTGPGISKLMIRGLGYNRVVVLFDDLRQEGQQWGDEHGLEIGTSSFDQVEIIRGPGSLMYGSDAMAGVVNYLSPKPLPDGKMLTTASALYQSNTSAFSGALEHNGSRGGFNWLLSGATLSSGPFRNPSDGAVFNSGFNQWNADAGLGVTRQWGYSRLHLSTFNQQLGLVAGERDSSGNWIRVVHENDSAIEVAVSPDDVKTMDIVTPFQRIGHHRASLHNYFHIKGQTGLRINLSLQQNNRLEFEESDDEAALEFNLTTAAYDVRLYLPTVSRFESTFGITGMWQQNRIGGEEFLIPEYSLFDFGSYLVTKRQFGKLHLSGGVRGDIRSMNVDALCLDSVGAVVPCSDNTEELFTAADLTFGSMSGSLGGALNLSKSLTAKLNLSRGFRAPNISELSSNGAHEGTFRYEYGDTDLKPEQSWQLDAGAVVNAPHVSFEVAGFTNSISNYIYLQKLQSIFGGDSIPDMDEGAPAFQYRQDHARLFGGEVILDFHPHPLDWLHIGSDLSVVLAERPGQPDSVRYLPFIPPIRYKGEIKVELPSGTRLKSSFVSIGIAHHFAQNRVLTENDTETETPAYTLVRARIGTTYALKNVSFKLWVIGDNLLNTSYQDHLSRLKYAGENPLTGTSGIYNMGRNVSLKLVVPVEGRVGKQV